MPWNRDPPPHGNTLSSPQGKDLTPCLHQSLMRCYTAPHRREATIPGMPLFIPLHSEQAQPDQRIQWVGQSHERLGTWLSTHLVPAFPNYTCEPHHHHHSALLHPYWFPLGLFSHSAMIFLLIVSPTMEVTPWGKRFAFLIWPLTSQNLEQCPAHSRYSLKKSWMSKWMKAPDQHCPIGLSAMMEMFYVCGVQHGGHSHWSHG